MYGQGESRELHVVEKNSWHSLWRYFKHIRPDPDRKKVEEELERYCAKHAANEYRRREYRVSVYRRVDEEKPAKSVKAAGSKAKGRKTATTPSTEKEMAAGIRRAKARLKTAGIL